MREIHPPELIGKRVSGLDRDYPDDWRFGHYVLSGPCNRELGIVTSKGEGWDHVSVSTSSRCPNWQEMCFVKNLFWTEEELVIQYHPPKSVYLNCNPHVLHMWKPQHAEIPMPPRWMIGPYDKMEEELPDKYKDEVKP